MEYNFFKLLTLGYCFLLLLYCFMQFVFPQATSKLITKLFFPEKKPIFIYPLFLAVIVFIAFVWYKVFTLEIAHSWVIASFFSLALVKGYYFSFQYETLRNFSLPLLNDPKNSVLLNIVSLVLSGLLLLLGSLVY